MKCISDIKNREWVVPAMNYLVRILQNCLQSSSKLGKNILRVCFEIVIAFNFEAGLYKTKELHARNLCIFSLLVLPIFVFLQIMYSRSCKTVCWQ